VKFTIQKTIVPAVTLEPDPLWKKVQKVVLLILVAVPLGVGILVVGGAFAVWYLSKEWLDSSLKTFGIRQGAVVQTAPLERATLFHSEQLHLSISDVERDDLDESTANWLEQWDELEDQGYCPVISRLADLCRKSFGGLFLQVIEPQPGSIPAVTSWLVYLNLDALLWERVTETYEYYLVPHEEVVGLFKGLNPYSGELQLRIEESGTVH
jgi:hypothetical protein